MTDGSFQIACMVIGGLAFLGLLVTALVAMYFDRDVRLQVRRMKGDAATEITLEMRRRS